MIYGIKGFFTFFTKQQKRLLARPAYLVLLLLIPIMSFALSMVSDDSGGLAYVALANEGSDPVADEVIGSLLSDKAMVNYSRIAPEECREAVETGKVDAAWLFCEDFSEAVADVAMGRRTHPLVTVITGEDTPVGALAREQLYASIYPYLSNSLYLGFTGEELGVQADDAAGVLAEFELKGDIITHMTISGEVAKNNDDYIVGSLRGLLALCVMLCAFACVMYALKDSTDGVYDFIPQRSRFFPLLSGVLSGALDAGVVAAAALFISGNRMNLWDLLSMALYVLSVTAFAFLVGSLCARREVLGVLLPVIIFVTAIVCPVFINIYGPEAVRMLLPTYLYLQAYGNPIYCLYMVIYTAVAGVIAYPVFCVRTKK